MKAQRNFMIEETMCEATKKLWLHLLQRWWWQCDYWTVGGLTELSSALLNLSSAGRSWSSPVETKQLFQNKWKQITAGCFGFSVAVHVSFYCVRARVFGQDDMLLVISPASLLRATALSSRSLCLCRGMTGLGCLSHAAAPKGTNNTEAIRQTWAPECTVTFSWMDEFLHEPGVKGGVGRGGEARHSGAASCFYSVRCDKTFWSDGGATVVNRPLLVWFS